MPTPLQHETGDIVTTYTYSAESGLNIIETVIMRQHGRVKTVDPAEVLDDADLEDMKRQAKEQKNKRAIVGFEDEHASALNVALRSMWPEQDVQVYDEYNNSMLRNMIERDDVAFVVTDMLMPCAFKSRDVEHAGAAVIARCVNARHMCRETHSFVDASPVPAVCVSSSYHHDSHVNFGNTLLRAMGVEMVDEADKTMAIHWRDAIKKGMTDGRYNTTGSEITVERVRARAEGAA